MLGSVVLSARPRSTNFSIEAIISDTKREEEEDEDVDIEGEEDEDQGEERQESPVEEKFKKKEKRPKVVERSTCSELDGVKCTLDNKELWDKFCEFGTEMIITRTGRRMFPTVRVSFSNLETEPGTKYLVLLDIVPCDNKRYRYAYHRSAWLVAGKADPPPPHRLYAHPDGPFTGEQLKKQVISFEKVKITNNETDNTGQVILNSMHKFQPRVYLVRRKDGECSSVSDIESEEFRSFVFPETQFTAVTAYQNQLITKLKIESNPFAKGFRDTSSSEYDDNPYPHLSNMPGGMPGMDPFSRMGNPMGFHHESNNNLMMAAEKARMMMMHNSRPLFSPPTTLHSQNLPISPELLARYSAIQTLGFYNPALLAAALRHMPSSTSPRSPESSQSHRYSPYTIPKPSHSPTLSPGREDERRSLSPPSSPSSAIRPSFPIYR